MTKKNYYIILIKIKAIADAHIFIRKNSIVNEMTRRYKSGGNGYKSAIADFTFRDNATDERDQASSFSENRRDAAARGG